MDMIVWAVLVIVGAALGPAACRAAFADYAFTGGYALPRLAPRRHRWTPQHRKG